jgi:hypothetical protein
MNVFIKKIDSILERMFDRFVIANGMGLRLLITDIQNVKNRIG